MSETVVSPYQQAQDARTARRAAFLAKVPAIIKELNVIDAGARWVRVPNENDHAYDPRPELRNQTAAESEVICLTYDDHKSRVGVYGRYGKLADDKQFWPRDHARDFKTADPTMAAEREPRILAREIARRFLPNYREALALYRTVVDRQTATTNAVSALQREIATLAGSALVANRARDPFVASFSIPYDRDNTNGGISHGSVVVSQDHVRIELSGNADFARTFARFLGGLNG